jgi:subtilisin family serine protease
VSVAALFAEGADEDRNPVCLSNGPLTAKFVVAGTGRTNEYPSGAAGKIAIVQRGGTDPGNIADPTSFTFLAKAKYAKQMGAIGVVVVNIIDSATGAPRPIVRPGFTLPQSDVTKVVPLALVSIADGAALKAAANATVTMQFNTNGSSDSFDTLNGTSMACPHAVGAAALVWAASPNSTATNVATALEQTAKDLGAAGKDNTFGYGLIDAAAAAKQLNPAAFGSGATPPPAGQVGRYAGRRGH